MSYEFLRYFSGQVILYKPGGVPLSYLVNLVKMRCSKANRPSVYPLRELPAGARQCGVPDVYLLASSRAERGAGGGAVAE